MPRVWLGNGANALKAASPRVIKDAIQDCAWGQESFSAVRIVDGPVQKVASSEVDDKFAYRARLFSLTCTTGVIDQVWQQMCSENACIIRSHQARAFVNEEMFGFSFLAVDSGPKLVVFMDVEMVWEIK
jgi:hypothetical protein